MRKEPKKGELCKPQCYMPCPCLKIEYGRDSGQETLCINGEEIKDIKFVDLGFIPQSMLTDKVPNNSLCLNTVYADESGFIKCGTSQRRIKVRDYHISTKNYLDAQKRVKELYNGNLTKINSCPECLYKTIVSQLELQEEQKNEEKGYVNSSSNC